jgi:hypothetical protein
VSLSALTQLYFGIEADFPFSDAIGDECRYFLEILAEVERFHLGEDGLVALDLTSQLSNELLNSLYLSSLLLALQSLRAAIEVDGSQRHPLLVVSLEDLEGDGWRLLIGLFLHYYHYCLS